ncbi:alpha-N-acetylglucosaminidase [Bacteroides ovatus]|jgi:alpha-N-acetylglucosaminidase|uniref:alpha-N-acetylglucosaminidase n=1 Tax=Bacteroides ovatus TaxID=28116 RepID=UPI00189DA8A6|nr:alpha-N-acetylglucosaminidase [Bacteroides ovatus]MCE8794120.1 alpha-N-acetylglucosaminidase [Bacteroides ovatus]
MKKYLLLLLFLLLAILVKANPVKQMLERFQKGLSSRFEIEVSSYSDQNDYFELYGGGRKVTVRGNNYVSVAFGINWYLKYYCHAHVSFCEDQLPNLPVDLPQVKERHTTKLSDNFYMNYCTFSYTTAFWDWKRWEREIDLMAMSGINMPMAMVGAEVVWRNTLLKFGYTLSEVKEFLCGPAYLGWLLMGNLENIGGPLPDEWFNEQIALQKKIVARMREYGMRPVFQGFFGMVPSSLKEKFPEVRLIEQGLWNSLQRPPILDPTDPLFEQMAKVWYVEYEKLYGKADLFGGDLFHEGGKTGSIDVTDAARRVQAAMKQYNPDATWVIQAWLGNPRKELLEGLDRKNTLIVDLAAEFWDNWQKRKGFDGFSWLWSHISNYGGNIGLHGRLDVIATAPVDAQKDLAASPSMKGTSSTPEGIEVNPVVFDLLNEMRWRSKHLDLDVWLKEYAARRYGAEDENLKEAWIIFHHTAYGTYSGHRRPSESVFCAPPSLKRDKITASAWSQCRIFYDPQLFAQGVGLFLQSADRLKQVSTYRYDVVDFVRQYLANLGREAYYSLVDAYREKSMEQLDYWSKRFLSLIEDQDALLSTHERFFVGYWLNMARSKSQYPELQDLYEHNARMLIGTWTEELSPVRDYAHKEWGGMLRDYYLPRWTNYIAYLKGTLEGQILTIPDSFQAERRWVNAHNKYSIVANADPVETARKLYNKYRSNH